MQPVSSIKKERVKSVVLMNLTHFYQYINSVVQNVLTSRSKFRELNPRLP